MSVWRREYFWPLVLVVLGTYFQLRNLNLLDWLSGDIVWPVLLIILGVWLIVRRRVRA
ncbi:MAG: DUF5668 domain-containing protein [Candidatus Dormibacteraeota bacterium]|nr:DUF5668 domain-containing protein [Candidatus Dormibacteraeota bacterium]